MQLVFGQDAEIARWVAERTHVSTFGPSVAIGVSNGNGLIAGIVYSNYREGNIEVAIAADHPGWCQRSILRGLFSYPFLEANCRRITAIIPAENAKSFRLCRGLGFKVEGLCREAFGSGDGILLSLLKRECKWIK